jgi:hypothetical protein
MSCAPTLAGLQVLVSPTLVELFVIDVLYAKKTQEPALQPAQIGREGHGRAPPRSKRVPLYIVKEIKEAAGCGTATLAALGIQRQAFNRPAIHGATQLALKQRLGQERQEIDAEQRLDAADLLEIDRRNLEGGQCPPRLAFLPQWFATLEFCPTTSVEG